MRALVVACFDSFVRSGTAWARALGAADGDVDHAILFARPGQLSDAQFRSLGFPAPIPAESIESITNKRRLQEYDLVILSLNGLRSRRFLTRFHRLWNPEDRHRPLAIASYPGLIFRFHLEGMMSRMSADMFLLNSPSDRRLYSQLLGSLGIDNDNGVCAGLSFLPPRVTPLPHPVPADRKTVLFVGQPTVPEGRQERAYVLRQMIRLAREFPQTAFVIKPRHRPTETTLHRMRYHYSDLAKGQSIPSNLTFRYDSMESVLDDTRLCMTFCSTAGLEAIARGIPTRILTDLGVQENLGNHFFMGSGLLADFADIKPSLEFHLEDTWYRDVIASASERRDAIRARLHELIEQQRTLGHPLPAPSDRLFGRSPAYSRFIEDTRGWPALELFGDARGAMGKLQRLKQIITPVQRAVVNRVRRYAPLR